MRLRFGQILKHNKNESPTEINLLVLRGVDRGPRDTVQ